MPFMLPGGLSLPQLGMGLTGAFLAAALVALAAHLSFKRRRRPLSESIMIWRLCRTLAGIGGVVFVLAAFGLISTLGMFLGLFGGMLLGLSLQAPMGGAVAWFLVSLKRPFRPGDRIQFPRLNMIGDVIGIDVMYTTLNQVGGSIASEEPVGRHVLIPNAILFSEVLINYTADQSAAFMLDEVVVRITYDSDWKAAEEIFLRAAREATGDVIAATGKHPYIRSDLYDYGVYMRLRYLTAVQQRAATSYHIQKRIFAAIQASPRVDVAIPYVYSSRAALDRRENGDSRAARGPDIVEIDLQTIRDDPSPDKENEILELAARISRHGLLQPIVVCGSPDHNGYEILAGRLRFHACRCLGWPTIPAVVQKNHAACDDVFQSTAGAFRADAAVSASADVEAPMPLQVPVGLREIPTQNDAVVEEA
ncbi:MAG: mechanosensitive ion channel [Rhodopirellula sp.]|nr:mechanosensitive ion channel [Rhodopirellula sp.]